MWSLFRKKIITSKWTMLTCAFFIIFINAIVNISVKSTTTELMKDLQINEKQLQTFVSSAAYVLSIPLSIYGSYIIHKVGTSKSLILWMIVATAGWLIFASGISMKNLVVINIGRFLQGGAFGALRVSFNAFCVKWFGKEYIAMSMGVLRCAHNIAHIIGSMLVIDVWIETWNWTPEQIFWKESIGLIVCILLCVLIWYGAKEHHKVQQQLVDKEKEIQTVFKTEGQVTITKDKESKVSIKIASDDSLKSDTQNIDNMDYVTHLNIMVTHSHELFKNSIFVLMIIVGFCYDGTIVSFTGILKRLLKKKFNRQGTMGIDMGVTKYLGISAPVVGYIIDKVRSREYFMLAAGICLVGATLSLYNISGTEIFIMYAGLLGISFGQVLYGNSFWPAIASVAGKQYQIVAYGFMGATTSIGAVLLPIFNASIVDYYDDISKSCLVFGILSFIGLFSSMIILIANNLSKDNFINRKLQHAANNQKELQNHIKSHQDQINNE